MLAVFQIRNAIMPPATTKKAKGAKKTAPKKAAPPKPPSRLMVALRKWFFRPTPLIISAFLITLVVSAPYIIHLIPDISRFDEYQYDLGQIEVNQPNEWVPKDLAGNVLIKSSFPEQVSLLDSDLCRELAMSFQKHPWVRSVVRVQITNKPSVQALLEYRRPVAFVETKEGLYPVDIEGVLLPPANFEIDDIRRLPHINNVSSMPKGNVGEAWGDVVVKSAAQIAAALTPDGNMDLYWNRFELTAVIAPNSDEVLPTADQLKFELATKGGSRIIWGKPPGADELEPTVEQKIGRMEQYLSRFGKFDEPNGPYRIDIRLFDAISLEPLQMQRYH